MDNDRWFRLKDGQTASDLEVVVPCREPIKLNAREAGEIVELRELLYEAEKLRRWHNTGDTLCRRVESLVEFHKRTAQDAIDGAESVRNDMLTYLRSVVFVLETVVGEHLNHFCKNERIRGAIAVIERHIRSLRQEKFNFHDSLWRRDLFRWDGPEQRLRDKVRELEEKLKAYEPQPEKVMAQPGEQPF